jgi:hypothetical protein
MSETKTTEFLVWYEAQKRKRFDNKRMLESYCNEDEASVPDI